MGKVSNERSTAINFKQGRHGNREALFEAKHLGSSFPEGQRRVGPWFGRLGEGMVRLLAGC